MWCRTGGKALNVWDKQQKSLRRKNSEGVIVLGEDVLYEVGGNRLMKKKAEVIFAEIDRNAGLSWVSIYPVIKFLFRSLFSNIQHLSLKDV